MGKRTCPGLECQHDFGALVAPGNPASVLVVARWFPGWFGLDACWVHAGFSWCICCMVLLCVRIHIWQNILSRTLTVNLYNKSVWWIASHKMPIVFEKSVHVAARDPCEDKKFLITGYPGRRPSRAAASDACVQGVDVLRHHLRDMLRPPKLPGCWGMLAVNPELHSASYEVRTSGRP